jgi:hypothetical protein
MERSLLCSFQKVHIRRLFRSWQAPMTTRNRPDHPSFYTVLTLNRRCPRCPGARTASFPADHLRREVTGLRRVSFPRSPRTKQRIDDNPFARILAPFARQTQQRVKQRSDPPERQRDHGVNGVNGAIPIQVSESRRRTRSWSSGTRKTPPTCPASRIIPHHPVSRLRCITPRSKPEATRAAAESKHAPHSTAQHSITITTQFCRLLNCCPRRTTLRLEPRYDGTHPPVIGPRHEGHSTVDIFAANRDVRPPVTRRLFLSSYREILSHFNCDCQRYCWCLGILRNHPSAGQYC